MSDDSSSKKHEEERRRLHSSPSGVVSAQKRLHSLGERDPLQAKGATSSARRSFFGKRDNWGIAGGAFFGLLALFGPAYILAPALQTTLPLLPLSLNLKISIADTILIAVSFALINLAIFAYGKNLRSIGFTKINWRHVGLAAGAFVLYFILSAFLANTVQHVLPYNQSQPQLLGYNGLSGVEIAVAFIPLVILTPLAEESIFRGFMFNGFRRHLPFWLAAIGVSAIFALAHGQINVGLDVFVLSMVSCYLRETTQSLWPSIFLHAIKNGVAFCLLYLYNGH